MGYISQAGDFDVIFVPVTECGRIYVVAGNLWAYHRTLISVRAAKMFKEVSFTLHSQRPIFGGMNCGKGLG